MPLATAMTNLCALTLGLKSGLEGFMKYKSLLWLCGVPSYLQILQENLDLAPAKLTLYYAIIPSTDANMAVAGTTVGCTTIGPAMACDVIAAYP